MNWRLVRGLASPNFVTRSGKFVTAGARALALVFTLIGAMAPAHAGERAALQAISEGYYEMANHYALEILRTCPPENCVLLSLGQSMTLVDAFLRAHIRRQGITGPYMNYAPVVHLVNLEKWPEEEADRWIGKMLPPKEMLAGKSLLILRVVMAGFSIEAAFPAIREHYHSEGINGKVGAFLIAPDNASANVARGALRTFGELKGDSVVVVDEVFADKFAFRNRRENSLSSNFERYHQYRPLRVPDQPVEHYKPRLNPAHQVLDQLVDRFLTQTDCAARLRGK